MLNIYSNFGVMTIGIIFLVIGFHQLELFKQAMEEWQMTPIPKDVDINDED